MFPNRAPMERAARLHGLFLNLSLKFLIKIPLNKEIHPLSQRPLERSVPPCSPKAGTLWIQTSISRALSYLSGSPVKEPSLQVPLIELPRREMPHS